LRAALLILAKPNSVLTIQPRTCSYYLSQQEVADIGTLHNDFLDEFLSEVNPLANYEDEVVRIFGDFIEQEEIPNGSNILEWLTETMTAEYEYDISEYEGKFAEYNTVRSYYNSILSAVDEYADYSELTTALSQIKSNAILNLECFDLDFILSCASVASKSAYYWTPVADGGLGNEPPGGCTGMAWWKRAIAGDVGGLAGAFMEIGIVGMISAAAIPGSNAVLVGTLAVAAGFSSAMAVAGGC
jgi:hypothetical protein